MDSIACPNCGHENSEDDRFCSNCGTRLTPVSPPFESQRIPDEGSVTLATEEAEKPETTSIRGTIPPPVTPSFARNANDWESQRVREPVDDDWKMSDLGPPPDRKRRKWLWALLILMGAVVLCCVGAYIFFALTDTGQQMFDEVVATAEAISTEQAGN